jgi:hypothetical protein
MPSMDQVEALGQLNDICLSDIRQTLVSSCGPAVAGVISRAPGG